jgi:serine-type D-Ala-D-Ala carboxypeptidase (penicillin-binding protein 5/6)
MSLHKMAAFRRMIAIAHALLLAGALAAPAAARDQERISPIVPATPSVDQAPVALLVDVTSGQILHGYNADRRFAPASVTKVMTLLLAFDLIDEGRLDPAQVMVMSPAVYRDWRRKGSNMRLNLGDRVRVSDLLLGIANVSANDGSAVLAEGQAGSIAAWTAAMNAKASLLGMTGSHFGTPNGWPDQGQTFTTANDLIILGRALIERHPEKFRHFIGRRSFTFNDVEKPNHDPLIRWIRGADGIKTGFTNEAGFSYLGTAKRGNRRLMLVLAGVPRGSVRDELARNYIEWGFSEFERRPLFAPGEVVGHARVQGGSARKIALISEKPIHVSVPRGNRGEMQATIRYDGPLRAPVNAGDQVAVLEVTAPGMPPASIPLLAREDVRPANSFDRLVNGLTGWLP